MFNKFAPVTFVDKPRLGKAAGVFANRFLVCINRFDNIIERKVVAGRNKQQYLDATVVGNSF